MPLTTILLVLLGALIHAGWNIAAKKAHGDARFTFFSAAIMLVVRTPLCIWLGGDIMPTRGAKEWGPIALIGGHLLDEGDRVLRIIGAAAIAVGVIALALG